jgi:hypothetical protein
MARVQRIIASDAGQRSCVLLDGSRRPIVAPNEYLAHLHRLGRPANQFGITSESPVHQDLTCSKRFVGYGRMRDVAARFRRVRVD